MELKVVLADHAQLVCDGVNMGEVAYSISVLRDPLTGKSAASGQLTGDEAVLRLWPNWAATEIVSPLLGRVLIQIHGGEPGKLSIEIAQPVVTLQIDAMEAPNSASAPDPIPSQNSSATLGSSSLTTHRGRI